MSRTTILLVDDHQVVREGLRALLESQPDLEVIGEAENGREAVALAGLTHPQVVLMDIAMPLVNGREATRQILKTAPGAKVLVLSCYNDDDCIRQMLAAGASGYLLKQTAAQDLAPAIREVRRGAQFLSPSIAKRRQANHTGYGTGRSSTERPALTARELEVLHLIAEGFSNREMAGKLGISIKTVEKHRQQVMNKLNIHEVAGLTRFAIAQGIVSRRELVPA